MEQKIMSNASLKGYRKIADFSTKEQAEKFASSLKKRAMSGTVTKTQKRIAKNSHYQTDRKGRKRRMAGGPNDITYYRLWAK